MVIHERISAIDGTGPVAEELTETTIPPRMPINL
jgi:hypothetical protein